MGKFSDDIPLKPRGTVQPTTVGILLRKLHVKDAPFEKQTEAVRDWLDHNRPGPTMKRSLERHGFGELVRGGASAPSR
jgi:hypothetical protein